jgi:hypothetical protein
MILRLPSVARITGVADTGLAPGAKWEDLVPHHHPKRDTSLIELAE